MEVLPISLCVVTHNSEGRLKKLIEHHRPYFAEIVVVDQWSTDGTWEDAQELADIAVRKRKKGFVEPERQYCVDLSTQPWVLVLDDDEEVSPELLSALPELLATGADVFWFKFKNLVEGVDIHPILGDDPHLRLFRRGAVRWPEQMHGWPEKATQAIVLYSDLQVIHHRSWDKTVKSNKARESLAPSEVVTMQNSFLREVEKLLKKNGVKV